MSTCEYPLSEEFLEKSPPASFATIELTFFKVGDTIPVVEPTKFDYSIDLMGKNFFGGKINLNDQEWAMEDVKGSIFIDPVDFTFGYQTIYMEIYFSSGTGSVADRLGAEGYTGKFEWVLFVENRQAPYNILSTFINQDGYLTITWPVCDQLNFDYYHLKRSHGSNVTNIFISNIFQNEFIDSCYYGSTVLYQMQTVVKGSNPVPSVSTIYKREDKPVIHIEDHGPDSLKLFWNKSRFGTVFTLSSYGTLPTVNFLTKSSDTCATVPKPMVGLKASYKLLVESDNETKCFAPLNYTELFTIENFTYGIAIEDKSGYFRNSGYISSFIYNPVDKVAYVRINSFIRVFDIETLTLKNEKQIENISYGGRISTSLTSATFAAFAGNELYVYENKELIDPEKIPLENQSSLTYMDLLSDNQIAIVQGGNYKLINMDDHSIVNGFPVGNYSTISSSRDGRYAGANIENDLKIYEKKDSNYELIYNDDRYSFSLIFNPEINNQVLLGHYYSLEIRILPHFSLAKTMYFDGIVLIKNFDPETGYLLVASTDKIYIVDIASYRILLSLKCNDQSVRLYNNKLLLNNGLYLDISAYLP